MPSKHIEKRVVHGSRGDYTRSVLVLDGKHGSGQQLAGVAHAMHAAVMHGQQPAPNSLVTAGTRAGKQVAHVRNQAIDTARQLGDAPSVLATRAGNALHDAAAPVLASVRKLGKERTALRGQVHDVVQTARAITRAAVSSEVGKARAATAATVARTQAGARDTARQLRDAPSVLATQAVVAAQPTISAARDAARQVVDAPSVLVARAAPSVRDTARQLADAPRVLASNALQAVAASRAGQAEESLRNAFRAGITAFRASRR